ncbi:hypothetical protein [Arcanobacterium canis]
MALTVHSFKISELSTYYKNPRSGNVDAIAESLEKNGQYRAIAVNAGTFTGRKNEILAGNHTFLAAKSLGWETIDATVIDVDEQTASSIVLADNRLADLGSYDEDTLADLLASLDDLAGTGYTDDDLADFIDADEPVSLTDPDEVPEAPKTTMSKPGDIIDLGKSRLYVGDSRDTASVVAAIRSMPGGAR